MGTKGTMRYAQIWSPNLELTLSTVMSQLSTHQSDCRYAHIWRPSCPEQQIRPLCPYMVMYISLSRPQTSFHRSLQSSRFSLHPASSEELLAPTSFFRMSTYVSAGLPRDRCPCVGSHRTSLLAGSSRCLWQWPASLILLAAIFLLSLGSCPYRSSLVMWMFRSTFRTARNILV